MSPDPAARRAAGRRRRLAGCAAGEDGAVATPAAATSSTPSETADGDSGSTSAAPSPSDGAVEVAVQVRDGQVRPKTRRVDVPLGATVRLAVTSEVADQPGLFEVETHETGLALVQLAVR